MDTLIQNQKDKIAKWYHKSLQEEDIFDKFISLWISFNAFYASILKSETEKDQIDNII